MQPKTIDNRRGPGADDRHLVRREKSSNCIRAQVLFSFMPDSSIIYGNLVTDR